MKILYFTWNEITKADVVSNLQRMGHDITLFTHKIKNYIMKKSNIYKNNTTF